LKKKGGKRKTDVTGTVIADGERDVQSKDPLESEGVVAIQNVSKSPGTSKPASTLSYATKVIPKLVTCVEIIKREWIQMEKANIQSKPWPKDAGDEELARGLEQYNEISCLEEVDDDDFMIDRQPDLRGLQDVSAEERPNMIIQLLSRRNL
jgi:hypothetical protein